MAFENSAIVSAHIECASGAAPPDSSYEARGRHCLATFLNCKPDILNDEQALMQIVRDAATASGATVLQIVSQKFQPPGITVVAVLAESHASLHTYPESQLVFWDCFTCGSICIPERSVPVLSEALGTNTVRQQVVDRF